MCTVAAEMVWKCFLSIISRFCMSSHKYKKNIYIYIYIYIYILHTPALIEYNGLEGSFVEVQHAACQIFNGKVGHFRILQKCYKQCIMLAI